MTVQKPTPAMLCCTKTDTTTRGKLGRSVKFWTRASRAGVGFYSNVGFYKILLLTTHGHDALTPDPLPALQSLAEPHQVVAGVTEDLAWKIYSVLENIWQRKHLLPNRKSSSFVPSIRIRPLAISGAGHRSEMRK